LELCFQKGTNEYLFPSMLPIHSINRTQRIWEGEEQEEEEEETEKEDGKEDGKEKENEEEDIESKFKEIKYLGRRIRIEDKRLMFHPSFLPQLICHILNRIDVSEEPYIWNEGLIFKHSKEYLIGLFMHGVMESNLQDNESIQSTQSSESIQSVLNSRKHGEPNRLKMMDVLIKGPNIDECQILMNRCLESIEYINIHFYGNLKWNQEVLFPLTIQKFYSIVDKRNILSTPLNGSRNENDWR